MNSKLENKMIKGNLKIDLSAKIKECLDNFDYMIENNDLNFDHDLKVGLSNMVSQALDEAFDDFELNIFSGDLDE